MIFSENRFPLFGIMREARAASGSTARPSIGMTSRRRSGMNRTRNVSQGEPAMPAYTWDHIHLRSPDPEATAQWFERMLGAQVIRSTQQGQPRIDLKLGGVNIFIAQVTPGDGVNNPPTTPYQGLDHFGLAVKDLDAVAADLKAKGVEFTRGPEVPRPGIKICFLRGPQGISVELLDRDPKYT
jgi:catechol 2,3-dioxygenase-like lactoylglutathione lyase family enzyme